MKLRLVGVDIDSNTLTFTMNYERSDEDKVLELVRRDLGNEIDTEGELTWLN